MFQISTEMEKENAWARVRKFISRPDYEYKRRAKKGLSLGIFRRFTGGRQSSSIQIESDPS